LIRTGKYSLNSDPEVGVDETKEGVGQTKDQKERVGGTEEMGQA